MCVFLVLFTINYFLFFFLISYLIIELFKSMLFITKIFVIFLAVLLLSFNLI
jgi:hypothetical protein